MGEEQGRGAKDVESPVLDTRGSCAWDTHVELGSSRVCEPGAWEWLLSAPAGPAPHPRLSCLVNHHQHFWQQHQVDLGRSDPV